LNPGLETGAIGDAPASGATGAGASVTEPAGPPMAEMAAAGKLTVDVVATGIPPEGADKGMASSPVDPVVEEAFWRAVYTRRLYNTGGTGEGR
jgi:hypothetical protein